MPFRSAQADRWPEAFTPIEIGLSGRCAPGVGLRRREGCLSGRRRPTAGRRLSRRLKSASPGAARRPSTDAKDAADWPIEIGLSGRCAPGVGLRRREGCLFGRRRPTVGRRLSRRLKSASPGAARRASAFADAKDAFPVGAGRPLAEGLSRPNSFGGGPTAGRRPQRVEFVRLVRCASHGFGRNTATRVPRPGALVMESCPPSISTHWRMEVRPMVLR
jgi:hypothetical protein